MINLSNSVNTFMQYTIYHRNNLSQITHHFQMSLLIFISIWNDNLGSGLGYASRLSPPRINQEVNSYEPSFDTKYLPKNLCTQNGSDMTSHSAASGRAVLNSRLPASFVGYHIVETSLSNSSQLRKFQCEEGETTG